MQGLFQGAKGCFRPHPLPAIGFFYIGYGIIRPTGFVFAHP